MAHEAVIGPGLIVGEDEDDIGARCILGRQLAGGEKAGEYCCGEHRDGREKLGRYHGCLWSDRSMEMAKGRLCIMHVVFPSGISLR